MQLTPTLSQSTPTPDHTAKSFDLAFDGLNSAQLPVLDAQFSEALAAGQLQIATGSSLTAEGEIAQTFDGAVGPPTREFADLSLPGKILPLSAEQDLDGNSLPVDATNRLLVAHDGIAGQTSPNTLTSEQPFVAKPVEPTALPDKGAKNLAEPAQSEFEPAHEAVIAPMSQTSRVDPKNLLTATEAEAAKHLVKAELHRAVQPTARPAPHSVVRMATGGASEPFPRSAPQETVLGRLAPKPSSHVLPIDASAPLASAAIPTDTSGSGVPNATSSNSIPISIGAGQQAASPSQSLAQASANLQPAGSIEQALEQVLQTREISRTARPEVLVRHAEFGLVAMRVEASLGEVRATLSARDPGFVPAVQAMLAERTVVAPNEASTAGNRSPDQGQGQNQSSHTHSQSHANHSQTGHSQREFSEFAESRRDSPAEIRRKDEPDGVSEREPNAAPADPADTRGLFA